MSNDVARADVDVLAWLLTWSDDVSSSVSVRGNYSVFLSHFILLTWYQSHSSDFLVPVDISGVLPLPSPSSSRHCQKRATAVTPTVPATLGYQHSAHSTAKEKA